jgi:hypothetical protein
VQVGRVVSCDLDIDVQALAYLVTVLIHRLHENDRTWWQEFRDEMTQARMDSLGGSVKARVLDRAIALVDDSIKGHDDE